MYWEALWTIFFSVADFSESLISFAAHRDEWLDLLVIPSDGSPDDPWLALSLEQFDSYGALPCLH